MNFVLMCISLAICIALGFFFLQLAFMALGFVYVAIATAASFVYRLLTGRKD